MCGIFGLVVAPGHKFDRAGWDRAVKELFLLSESRGKEAAGIAIATVDRIVVHKDSVSASRMLRTEDYNRAVGRALNGHFKGKPNGAATDDFVAAIGHCRLVTNGLQGIDANNQPVRRDGAVIVHNGIVVNVDALWARHSNLKNTADVDSEVIVALIEKRRAAGASIEAAIRQTFEEVYGESSVALLFRDVNALALATNTGSLFAARAPNDKAWFFASEKHICEELISGRRRVPAFEGAEITQVRAGEGLLLDISSLAVGKFGLRAGATLLMPQVSPGLGMQRRIEDKAERIAEARKNLRRCAKCVLPETMPFIEFDGAGVCNYCRSHEPLRFQPIAEIEAVFDRYRSKDGSPDCLVAFSGGRDSSYGLHLLKTKFRMTPIAYTYDWGMVTDLARRNQARMCGKLGIEHIWVSADIKKKRENIRLNVSAWLKKPDLGIIPLFMAGDKQFFKYCDSVLESTKLPLSVWCTNRMEKTDFKTGFLGVPPADSTMRTRPSTQSAFSKSKIVYQYGKRFLANPALINRSIPDTLDAFLSYYGRGQGQHSFLFDYHSWDEDEINEILISAYDWETARDTKCTWRIGDGTAPFYNYIYLTAAGFTEHDTFRSNQIREGVLSRERALSLIEEENVPRWASIREYTQIINIDFDETIRAIDRMPKLYMGRSG